MAYGNPFGSPFGSPFGGFGYSNMPQLPGSGPAPVGSGTGSWYTNPELLGALLSGFGSIYGAYSQNQSNQQNQQAIQQRNAMMAGLINPLMMTGQNQYANAMAQMAAAYSGQGAGGFTGMPAPAQPTPSPWTPGSPVPGQPQLPSVPTGQSSGPIWQRRQMQGIAAGAPAAASPNTGVTMFGGPMVNAVQGTPPEGMKPPGGGSQIPQMPGQIPAPGPAPIPGLTDDMRWNVGQLGPAPTASVPTPGEAFNAGQDGLLQSMRRDIGAVQDPAVTSTLSRAMAGDTQFNNTELFNALGVLDERRLRDQVTALQGSAGSFGQRFGTAGQQAEADLRGDYAAQVGARNAQLAQQSYEAAQGRAMQGLGLGMQREQFGTSTALQNAQRQLAAAGQLGSLGTTQQQMGLQAALANQGMAGQYGLAQFGAQNQAGQFNAQSAQDMYQFGAGRQLSYDQLAMQALAQANQAQMSQNQFNAGLIGMLGGLPMPNSMPSAWGGAMSDIGMLMMLYPQLRNL